MRWFMSEDELRDCIRRIEDLRAGAMFSLSIGGVLPYEIPGGFGERLVTLTVCSPADPAGANGDPLSVPWVWPKERRADGSWSACGRLMVGREPGWPFSDRPPPAPIRPDDVRAARSRR